MLQVFTADGREVSRSMQNNATRFDLDLTGFGSGVYVLRYTTGHAQQVMRVVVQ
ncbi:MAG: T9SS type A sorting domain-containing protein [Bacteroidia bacterium]|nr:T9SS type A sorting domain-containing protein [Bacteroidia bacterium]